MMSTSILWRARLSSWVGYGHAALALAQAVRRHGWPIGFDATLGQGETLESVPGWIKPLLVIPGKETACVWVTPPHLPYTIDRPTIVYTMWESTRLDRAWVRQLNRATAVVVPCTWCAATFSASGVTAPLSVVPLGVDPTIYHATDRPEPGEPFVVGLAGRMAHGGNRKGIVEAIQAFRAAFTTESVRLEIKCLPDDPVPDFGDPRVLIRRGHWTAAQMAAWYRSLDLFLSASKGDGWGLHLLEAMACGTPCVTSLWSGPADYCDALNSYSTPYTLAPAEGVYHGYGHWVVPTRDGLIAALRAAESDRAFCRRKGEHAAALAARFTWDRSGESLSAILERMTA